MEEKISEVIVAHFNAESMEDDIYDQLLLLMERGFKVRDFTHLYEELLYRVPIQYIGKDFYKYFPFSRNNENQLYLFFRRLFDVVLSCIGLVFGLLISPLILLGNPVGQPGTIVLFSGAHRAAQPPFSHLQTADHAAGFGGKSCQVVPKRRPADHRLW
jgi:hypothetical protein